MFDIDETDKRFWTTLEVAEHFRVTRPAVTRWLQEGRMKGFRVGNAWRIPRDSLVAFIEESSRRGS